MRLSKAILFFILIFICAGFKYVDRDFTYTVAIDTVDSGVFYGKNYENKMRVTFNIDYKSDSHLLYVRDVKLYVNGVEQKDKYIKEVVYYAKIDKGDGIIVGQRLRGPELPFSANFTEIFPKFEGHKKKWFRYYKMSKDILAKIDYEVVSHKDGKIIIREHIKADLSSGETLKGDLEGTGDIKFEKGLVQRSKVEIVMKSSEQIQGSTIRDSNTRTNILMKLIKSHH